MKTAVRRMLAVLAAATAVAGAPSAQADGLSLLSGNTGGSWYGIGAGLAQILTRHGLATDVEQGGGISNVLALATRTDAIGFTNAFVVPMAVKGEAPFETPLTDVVAVAILMENFGQFVVAADSGVESFEQLRGRPYISQPLSASSTTAFEKVLNAYGLSESDLDLQRGDMAFGAEALRDGRAIGFHATTAYPVGTVSELAITHDLRLLAVSDEAFARIVADNPGFSRGVIPAGTYRGQDGEVATISAPTILITNRGTDADTIYNVLEVLTGNIGEVQAVHASLAALTPGRMGQLGDLDVHPGAARFFAERGQ